MTARFSSHGAHGHLSYGDFRREFGVDYTTVMIVDGPVPDLGAAAAACGAAAARELSAESLRALRAALAAAPDLPVRVADAGPDVGRGLFAAEIIPSGALIGEYAGVLTRGWLPVSRGGRFNPYLLKYPFECAYAIDAETRGNELRFANHSARGANARKIFLMHDGLLRALIVASARIEPGAQILLDYGPDYRFASAPKELAA